jgi:predicted PurR-regulated permease PerM
MPDSPVRSSQDQWTYTKKIWTAAGILALLVVVMLLMKTLLNLLLLTLAAIIFAVYFHGFAHLIRKYLGAGNKWSLALSIIINLLIIGLFTWFVGYRLQGQVAALAETLPNTIDNAKNRLDQTTLGSKILDYMNRSGNTEKTVQIARRFFSSTFGILSDVYIILLMGIFFTAAPLLYKKGIVKLMPARAKNRAEQLLNELHEVLSNWLKGEIFGFMFIAVLTGLGLWALGMPLILTLALIAGLLNFIPNFGPFIALVPAVLLALMEGTNTALLVVGLYTLIQVVQSAVTQPLIQEKMIKLPPALIIFGQVAMGLLAGFWGVLLATPVVALLMTVVNRLYVQQQEPQ